MFRTENFFDSRQHERVNLTEILENKFLNRAIYEMYEEYYSQILNNIEKNS